MKKIIMVLISLMPFWEALSHEKGGKFRINVNVEFQDSKLLFEVENTSNDVIFISTDFVYTDNNTHFIVVDEASRYVFPDQFTPWGRSSPFSLKPLFSNERFKRYFHLSVYYPQLLEVKGNALIFWSTVISVMDEDGNNESLRFTGSKRISLPISETTKALEQEFVTNHVKGLKMLINNTKANVEGFDDVKKYLKK